jgi:hypothetical protein
VDELPPDSRWGLILSGHTHGGQIVVSWYTRRCPPCNRPDHLAGLSYDRRGPVYVSRGLGVGGLPTRLRCRPELAVVVLREGSRPAAGRSVRRL